ncbi:MAG: hypothetical protein KBB91_02710 [Candidatus Pacebacteria bacterium]|jgi:hypothetical protein|nr:hypothetical protein [Candidatus Paceibacterota bacterium]MBP9701208.1 hypothetical protein [Candidatus Paceibacterota bacterium]
MAIIKNYSDLPSVKSKLIGKSISIKFQNWGTTVPWEICFLIKEIKHYPVNKSVHMYFESSDLSSNSPDYIYVAITATKVNLQFRYNEKFQDCENLIEIKID